MPRKLSGKGNGVTGGDRLFQSAAGTRRWTLDLLAGAMVRLTAHEALSRETVRRRLAEDDLKPRRRDMWCIPQVDGSYVARMGGCSRSLCRKNPIRRIQCGLLRRKPNPVDCGEVRETNPLRHQVSSSGMIASIGAMAQPICSCSSMHTGSWRHVKVTEHRAARDFALCMRDPGRYPLSGR